MTRYYSVEDAIGEYDDQYTSQNYLVVNDKSFSRGKVIFTNNYDYNGRQTGRSAMTYVFTKKYSGYPPQDLLLAWDPTKWSYFVGGKRLSESWTIKRVIDSTYQYELDLTGVDYRPQISVTNYAYNDYMQITLQNQLLPAGRLLTIYTYVHEAGLPESSTFLARYMLNPLSSKIVRQEYGNSSCPKAEYHYSWGLFNGDYRIDTVFSWTDANFDSVVSSSEFAPVKIVLNYDDFGNPLTVKDANGTVANFEWSSTYQNARLTKRTTTVNGLDLTRQYTYNALHLPDSEEDENGQKTTYVYDALGRLIIVKGPNNETLKTYTYNFKNMRAPGGQ